jgi:hypothetical protein
MRHRTITLPGLCIALAAGALLWIAPGPGLGDDAGERQAAPAARLSSAPYASDLWNFTAVLEGGYRLFTWFFITNEGPGEQSAAALWYLVHPDGRVAEYRNGRQQGRWKLSADRRRIDVASSSLDLHGPVRRVAIDSTSQRVKIDLHFPVPERSQPAASPGSSVSAFHTDTLQIGTPVEGTIWEGGMPEPLAVRGAASLTYAWTDLSVPAVVQRRIEFFAEQSNLAFYVSEIRSPRGDELRWLTVQDRDGMPRYESANFEMTLARPDAVAADDQYAIPGRLLIRDARLSLEIQPQRLLLRADPLDAVPQPFRFLFELQVAPQWYWIDAAFHLRLGAEDRAVEADGRGILAVIFVNPLPLPR